MAFDIGAGIGAVAGVAQNIFGFGEKRQDRRQITQQQKLTDIQMGANKDMANFNQDLALDMWQKTNTGAQVQEMKEAGINPALMYKGGGSGGMTAGAGEGGSASGGTASGSAQAMQANSGMAMTLANLGLLKAQKENIEADTANKMANAEKTAGIDTELGTQNVNESKSREALNTINAGIAEIGKEVAEATKGDAMSMIQEQARKMMGEANSALVKGVIDDKTSDSVMKRIEAETAGAILENDLRTGRIDLTYSQINQIKEQIKQGWKNLEFRGTDQVLGKYVEKLGGEVSRVLGRK